MHLLSALESLPGWVASPTPKPHYWVWDPTSTFTWCGILKPFHTSVGTLEPIEGLVFRNMTYLKPKKLIQENIKNRKSNSSKCLETSIC